MMYPDEDSVGAGTTEGGDGTPKNEPVNTATETKVTDGEISGDDTTAESENTDLSFSDEVQPTDNKGKKRSDFVPYNRFHEVNSAYRKEVEARAKLETKLEQMELQLARLQTPTSIEPELDQKQKEVADYYINPVISPLQKEIKELKDELMASKESAKLERALNDLSTTYPVIKDVPFAREVLENQYIMTPKSDLEETAKKLDVYFKERDKKVIINYLNGKKKDAEHKAGTPAGSPPAKQPKPLPKTATLHDRFAVAGQQALDQLKQK